MVFEEKIELGGRTLSIETGRLAKQAQGAVLVRYGDTVVLVTSCISPGPREGIDFLPLLVEYREKYYAAGKIPGGFFKREGRPSEKEILSSRLIDRPIRSLFPKSFRREVQIVANVLSSDQENDSDLLAMIGASASLGLAGAPFGGPIGAVRIGRRDGEFIVNPTFAEREECDIDLTVVTVGEQVTMLEGGMKEISDDDMVKAIRLALDSAPEIVKLQERLIAQCGREKMEFTPAEPAPEIVEEVKRTYESRFIEACGVSEKEKRQEAMDMIRAEALEALAETYPEGEKDIKNSFYSIEHDEVRRMVSERGQRIDGRGLEEVRQITCEVGVLPRTHGSAIFTRGQTQALAAITLGTAIDEQRVDDLEGESSKSYMLHYNFPPSSVGEVRPLRGTSRREIGHGALAEKAIKAVIPAPEDFPYTVRIVSEILESNGSSSMATVCSSALALMDAGVPIKAPVAGIAMGLVKDGDKYTILTDILGAEDHHGDMDFKVAGTREGVTTVQMDLKIPGIPMDVVERIVVQAVAARNHIHDVMDETLRAPREEISSYAPRIVAIQIDREKIRDVIGPGGKMIRSIIEETGAVIDIEDDGTVKIASPDGAALEKALERVNAIIEDPEVGKVYNGTVRRIADFGAFVEILPGKDGLLHISEIENRRVERVTDVLKEDDKVDVKVLSVERDGKVRLSRRVLLPDYDPNEVRPPRPERRGPRDSRGSSRDGRGSRDSRGSSRDGRRPHHR